MVVPGGSWHLAWDSPNLLAGIVLSKSTAGYCYGTCGDVLEHVDGIIIHYHGFFELLSADAGVMTRRREM